MLSLLEQTYFLITTNSKNSKKKENIFFQIALKNQHLRDLKAQLKGEIKSWEKSTAIKLQKHINVLQKKKFLLFSISFPWLHELIR